MSKYLVYKYFVYLAASVFYFSYHILILYFLLRERDREKEKEREREKEKETETEKEIVKGIKKEFKKYCILYLFVDRDVVKFYI